MVNEEECTSNEQRHHIKDDRLKTRTETSTNCSNYNNQKDVNCRFNKHNLGYKHRHRRRRLSELPEQHHQQNHHPHHNYHRRKWWNEMKIIFYICHVLFITSTIALSDSNGNGSDGDAGASSSQEEHIKYSMNIIETRFGAVRGIIMGTNPPVDAYLGIPYASPPVGSLRFMPPITPSTWKNIRIADRFSAVCPQNVPVPTDDAEALLKLPRARVVQLHRLSQLLSNQSEDCLYLNLYVPRIPHQGSTNKQDDSFYKLNIHENTANNNNNNNSNSNSNNNNYSKLNHDVPTTKSTTTTTKGSTLLPTILYIHGESYEWNSGNPYDGSVLAGHGKIIVVTINFRLGILGFMKTGGKGSAQGNFGLMDLVGGLHWLRENLPAFGGDPEKITVMGHGTGAALANILAVSPVASDLIRRTILMSGSALSPWAIQKDPLFIKRKVAEQTGCHGDLMYEDLAPCLRTKSLEELLAVRIDSPRFLPSFAPFVDGTVIVAGSGFNPGPLTLPLSSAIVSTSGIEFANFPTRDLMFCLNSIESYMDLSAQDLEFGFNETRRDRIVRTFVRNVFYYHLNEIYAVLKNEYTDWERAVKNPMSSRDSTLEFLSDGHTAAPAIRLAYLHSLKGGRSFFMHFNHRTREQDFPQRMGSVGGEDVPFAFGLPISPLYPHNYSKEDVKVSAIFVNYIANFVRNGNPNDVDNYPTDISNLYHRDHYKHLEASLISSMHRYGDMDLKKLRKERNLMESSKYARHHKRKKRKAERMNEFREPLPKLPFWDAYDSVNQLFLELGQNVEVKSHYRGHKLSMWLNLIPQLHQPVEFDELPIRHHHFPEDSAQFYDGIIRSQLSSKTNLHDIHEKLNENKKSSSLSSVTTIPPSTAKKTSTPQQPPSTSTAPSTTTDCITNITMAPVIYPPDTKSSVHNVSSPSTNQPATGVVRKTGNLLRKVSSGQYHSYTTALMATVAVGFFLLVLNILIFAGIYYQREKRIKDTRRKEELKLSETEVGEVPGKKTSIDITCINDEKSSYDYTTGMSFREYSCYDEKYKQSKEKMSVSASNSPYKGNWPTPANLGQHPSDLVCSTKNLRVKLCHESGGYGGGSLEDCTVKTSSLREILSDKICSTRPESIEIEELSPDIPEPPPPPKVMITSGILRQSNPMLATPSTSKKRVHIQEVNV